VDSTPCECGRAGQRLRYSAGRIAKPMQVSKPASAAQPGLLVG